MASDPNYNPGFFGWMWDGIRNPLGALNTFENNVLVPAADRIGNFLAPVQKPVDNFLTTNPVGQAVAPALQQGVGVTITPGSNTVPLNGAPQVTPHLGMATQTPVAKNLDVNAIIDKAVAAHQVPLKAPGADRPLTSTQYAPDGSTLSQGGGWNSGTNLPESKPMNTSRLGDGTEYKTRVINGQTVYEIIKSPTNPAANGQTVDDANFSNILNGRSFTPFTGAAANAPMQITHTNPTVNAEGPQLKMPDLSDPTIATAAAGVVGAGGAIVGGMTQADAAVKAAQIQAEAAEKARKLQEDQFNAIRADWEPWRDAGIGALDKLKTFDQDNPAFGMAQFQADPGYSFRLSEGMKALQNSAAARGNLFSGNTMKAISNYGQEAASQEYQNAFNRYNVERGQRLNNLQSLANVGQTATQQVGSAGQNYANNAGNAITGGANALAQGRNNAANANASGYMGVTNALINALDGFQSASLMNKVYGGR